MDRSTQNHTVEKCRILCSREYFANRYNLLRIFSLTITLLLLGASFLYSFGAIYDLSLSDIWCDTNELRSWDEVVAHNVKEEDPSGVGGCWRSKVPSTDDEQLFATVGGGFKDATVSLESFNVIKLCLYAIIFICLFSLFIGYGHQTVVDCKKTANSEW